MSKPLPDEPTIMINGVTLNVGQAMTLRVALQSFLLSIEEDNSTIMDAYRARGMEINKIMVWARD